MERKPARLTTKTVKVPIRRPVTSTNAEGPRQSIWGRSQRYPEARVITPGPAKYSLPAGSKIHGRAQGHYRPGYSMRSRTLGAVGTGFALSKARSHDAITPGPGHYEASPMSKLGKTFSGLITSKSEVTPGPHDYITTIGNVGRDQAHKYTMRARTTTAWSADFKGLSKSRSEPNITKKSNGLIADAPTPGPSHYNFAKSFGSGGLKKSIGPKLFAKDPFYPGPGKYNAHLVNKLGSTGLKYTLHDRTLNKCGGSFIDGDTNNKPRKTAKSPGPGRYNHASSFYTQSFNQFANARGGVLLQKAGAADFAKVKTRKAALVTK